MSSGSGFETVIRAFNEHGHALRRSGGGYTTQCPTHPDNRASLSISPGEKGAAINCFAGCETIDVITAVGLSWPDIFDNDSDRPKRAPEDNWMPCQMDGCPGQRIAEYKYTDENGKFLFATCRCSRKGDGCPSPFAQWRPDSSKKYGKAWSLGTTRRVVYRLPEVRKAIEEGRRIWFTEGEKDADLVVSKGEVATSSPMGAGSWLKEYARYFRGAEVIIVVDCDEPGLKHGAAVYADLSKFAKSVRVVCTPVNAKGADATDHFSYGLGFDDFESVFFEEVEPRPRMVIQVEPEHREKAVNFLGFSQARLEQSLVGAMLRYGHSYKMAAADMEDEKLALAAHATSRLAARGALISPETVAVEIEDMGTSVYDKVLPYLEKYERSAFRSIEDAKKGARIIRERTMRREITAMCRAVEGAVKDERRTIDDVLGSLRQMVERQTEEFVNLDEYCPPASNVFCEDTAEAVTEDVVAEVQREVAAAGNNVRVLRPVVTDRDIEEALSGMAGDGAEDLPRDQRVHGRQNA